VNPENCPNCGGTGFVAKPVDLNGKSEGVAFIRAKCPCLRGHRPETHLSHLRPRADRTACGACENVEARTVALPALKVTVRAVRSQHLYIPRTVENPEFEKQVPDECTDVLISVVPQGCSRFSSRWIVGWKLSRRLAAERAVGSSLNPIAAARFGLIQGLVCCLDHGIKIRNLLGRSGHTDTDGH
jgi:hypothetical protein